MTDYTYLFVYGTLLRGESRHYYLNRSKLVDLALLNDYAIYDLIKDDYPGIKNSEGNFVIGEVYEIQDRDLPLLDFVEGFDGTEGSLFLREKVKVTLFSNANEIECYTYVYNRGLKEAILIEHGDYRRYKLEKESDTIIYLAYGSNMSSERLIKRIGEPISKHIGILNGFKLKLNKYSKRDNSVKANIIYTGKDKCFCVAYEVNLSQLKKLDEDEGVPEHYYRILAIYETPEKQLAKGELYIANPNMLEPDLNPSKDYLSYIIRGYEENNLPLDEEIKKYMEI